MMRVIYFTAHFLLPTFSQILGNPEIPEIQTVNTNFHTHFQTNFHSNLNTNLNTNLNNEDHQFTVNYKTVYYPPTRSRRQSFSFGDKIPARKQNINSNINSNKNRDGKQSVFSSSESNSKTTKTDTKNNPEQTTGDLLETGSGSYGMDRAVVHRIDEKQSISYEYDSYNDDEDLYSSYDDNSGDGEGGTAADGSADRFNVNGRDPKCKCSGVAAREFEG